MWQARVRALEPTIRRSMLLIVMYATAGVVALLVSRTMVDFDYGWHLRTGEWIVAHRTVPDLELFSNNLADERWVAYSWAYEVLLCALRSVFGIQAPILLSVTLSLLIAHLYFSLVRRTSGQTVVAAALTCLGIVAMGPMLYGRSTMFTILFALLELHCLVRATVLGQRKALYFVPLVFVAWANVHVQFLHGLFLYVCFLAQAAFDAREKADDPVPRADRIRLLVRMAGVGVLCLAATLVNPYHVRVYDPLLRYLWQAPTIYHRIQELRPFSVGSISVWTAILIALVAVWNARKILDRPFLLLMFAVAAFVGFRSARDAWFVAVIGSTIAAVALGLRRKPEESLANPIAVFVGTACVVLFSAFALDVSKEGLAANLRKAFPVGAADFIESEKLQGPMYNHYNWGGYLMWRLPDRKVAMDGRSWVHKTDAIERNLSVWRAEPGWSDDPELAAAGFVVGGRGLPLTTALSSDPRFRLAYGDEVAEVYVRTGP